MKHLYDEIAIVHQTDRWVAINKPSGLLSVPGKGEANQFCAAAWCRFRFPQASGPITVHRLDMDTSGLLLMALDAESQRRLSMLFESRAVAKTYHALVAGHVAADHGTIDAPMRLDVERRPIQIIDTVQGKAALTEYTTLERRAAPAPHTRLELTPRTGRTHQLRLHMQHIGHPILGDSLYGGRVQRPLAPRLCLHARTLAFIDPFTTEAVSLCSEPVFELMRDLQQPAK